MLNLFQSIYINLHYALVFLLLLVICFFHQNLWLGHFWLCILQLHLFHVCYFSRGFIASLYSTAHTVNGEATSILSSLPSVKICSKWVSVSLLLFGLIFVKCHLSYCWSKSTLVVSCQALLASLDLNLRIGWHRWYSFGRLPAHQSRHWLQCSVSCRKLVHYPITATHRITTAQRHTKSFHSLTQL